jgi:prepilin-type N-terminal cleavage/methylation domain-containing protein
MQRLWHRIGYPARCRPDDAGFTLIEVVVSFVIFAIVAASATAAIVNGIGSSRVTKDRVAAANVAQQEIQRLEATAPSDIPLGTSSTPAPVGNETFTVARTITNSPASTPCSQTVSAGTAHTVNVHVEVSWPNSQGRSVQMDTVIACR